VHNQITYKTFQIEQHFHSPTFNIQKIEFRAHEIWIVQHVNETNNSAKKAHRRVLTLLWIADLPVWTAEYIHICCSTHQYTSINNKLNCRIKKHRRRAIWIKINLENRKMWTPWKGYFHYIKLEAVLSTVAAQIAVYSNLATL